MKGLFPTKRERIVEQLIRGALFLLVCLNMSQNLLEALLWFIGLMMVFAVIENIIFIPRVMAWWRSLLNKAALASLRRRGILPQKGKGTDEDVKRLATTGYRTFALKIYMQIHDVSLLEAIRAVDQMKLA